MVLDQNRFRTLGQQPSSLVFQRDYVDKGCHPKKNDHSFGAAAPYVQDIDIYLYTLIRLCGEHEGKTKQKG